MSVRGASARPALTLEVGTYMCGRCGGIFAFNMGRPHNGYCIDCLPEARQLGWAPKYTRRKAA
ncbi:hypothetical protein GCM10023259_103340 [Thermocatellispora tengchongensis]|uniref:Uncharacterized protein n=1 Tax=Arthrobacter ginkgonis TaxID=1630594 RepID=A0ABP7DL10_9MICC